MRTLAAILFLVICSAHFSYGQQKTRFGQKTEPSNPADYTLKVHISASRLRHECANCINLLRADAILNGKKLQLQGNAVVLKKTLMLIAPGDYPLKLTQDIRNSDGSLMQQTYDILLPDGTVWQCFTMGISE